MLLSNKGTLLFQLGQFEEALALHEKAARLLPGRAEMWMNAAATLEFIATENQSANSDALLHRALGYYQRAHRIEPADAFILAEMALVLMKLYKFRHAAHALEQALESDPNCIPALRRLVRAYVMLQRHRDARRVNDRLRELGIDTEEVRKMTELLGKY